MELRLIEEDESRDKEVKVAYCSYVGEDIDEEVMDRIDGYLLLELLDWWKNYGLGVARPCSNPVLPVCPPPPPV